MFEEQKGNEMKTNTHHVLFLLCAGEFVNLFFVCFRVLIVCLLLFISFVSLFASMSDAIVVDGASDAASSASGITSETCTIPLLRKHLAICLSKYGPEHPDTLSTLNRLGVALGTEPSREEHTEGVCLLCDCYQKTDLMHGGGGTHIRTLAVLHDLAYSLIEFSPTKAFSLQEKCVENLRLVFGSSHPCVLIMQQNLGMLAYMTGEKQAESVLQDCFSKMQIVFGTKHPQTLDSMYWLSCCTRNPKKAKDIMQECLEKQKQIFSPDHLSVLKSMLHVARLSGNTPEAIHLLETCLESCLKASPPGLENATIFLTAEIFEMPLEDVVTFYRNNQVVACAGSTHLLELEVRRTLGEYKKDKNLLQMSLEAQKQIRGPDDPHTLRTMHVVGLFLERGPECISVLRECLERRKRVLGDYHPDTLETMHSLASALGSTAESLQLYHTCLEQQKHTLGLTDARTLLTMHNFAMALGGTEEAIELYRECLQLEKEALGLDDAQTLKTMYNLAFVLGESEEAITLFRTCLDRQTLLFGRQHEDTLRTMCKLGITLRHTAEGIEILQEYWTQVRDSRNPRAREMLSWLVSLFDYESDEGWWVWKEWVFYEYGIRCFVFDDEDVVDDKGFCAIEQEVILPGTRCCAWPNCDHVFFYHGLSLYFGGWKNPKPCPLCRAPTESQSL